MICITSVIIAAYLSSTAYAGKQLTSSMAWDQLHWLLIARETVFAGGNHEFGYVVKGANGDFVYNSLIPLVSEKYRNFGLILKCLILDGQVLFLSESTIFAWDGQSIHAYDSDFPWRRAAVRIRNKLYVNAERKWVDGMGKQSAESYRSD